MKERGQQSLQSSVFQSLDMKGPNMNANAFSHPANSNYQGIGNQSSNQSGMLGTSGITGTSLSHQSVMNNQNYHQKKKFVSEKPLNLAEMMKSQGAYKQVQNKKGNEVGSFNAAQRNDISNQLGQDFIRGTQVMRDFQLIAEPILPKTNQIPSKHDNVYSSVNQVQYGKQANKLHNNQSNISHPHTASSNNEGKDTSGLAFGAPLGMNNNVTQMSATNSKLALDNYYNTSSKAGASSENNALQDQNNNIFAQNRSLVAKAGQMQIFNNDVSQRALKQQQQLNQENQISVANRAAARKFVSPSSVQNNSSHNKNELAQNSQTSSLQQSQQLIGDIKPSRIRQSSNINNNAISQSTNPKYVDYINRFQPNEGQNSNKGGRQSLANSKIAQDSQDPNAAAAMLMENQDYFGENSKLEGWGQTSPDQNKSSNQYQNNGTYTGASKSYNNFNNNTSKGKSLKQNVLLQNLNISGEQMHIEEKGIKKGGSNLNNSSFIANEGYDSNQRNSGIQNYQQKFVEQLSGKVDNTNIINIKGNQNKAPLYDYLLVQISQDQFQSEFSNKISFNNELLDSFRIKRQSQITSINTNLPDSKEFQAQAHKQIGPKSSTNQLSSKSSENYFSPKSIGSTSVTATLQSKELDQPQFSSENNIPITIVKSPQFQLYQTSMDCVKIISQSSESFNKSQLTELDEDKDVYQQKLKSYVAQITERLASCGKVFKITRKKRYLRQVLSNGQQFQKIAKFYVIIIDSSLDGEKTSQSQQQNINSNSLSTVSKTIQQSIDGENSSSDSLSEECKSLNNQNDGNCYVYNENNGKGNQKFYADSQKDANNKQIINGKYKNVRNNVSMKPKGYDSENDARSMNSTTTSSTMPFLPTRNENGQVTNKTSARSLSQKGNMSVLNQNGLANNNGYQRRLQQKQMSMDESQLSGVGAIIGKEQNTSGIQLQLAGAKDQIVSKYPPTKIKIVQNSADYSHLEQHKINKALQNYNMMIQLCFRTKGKLNMPAVLGMAKQMGLIINKNWFTDSVFKSREHANLLKEKIIFYLTKIIQEETQPEGFPTDDGGQNGKELAQLQAQPQQLYKCFVGKGNNSILIRTLFKTRFWWLLHDKEEIERVNFMWTQIRKNSIIETFSCKFEDKKSGLKQTTANSIMQTPKTSASKLKKKRKIQQLQNSAQSLESSTDKKDSSNQLGKITSTSANFNNIQGIPNGNGAGGNQIVAATNEQQQAAQLAVKLYNKLEDNFHLSNKKALFLNMKNYYDAMGKDVFSAVPVTFHIKEGFEDPEFIRFKNYYIKEDEEIKKNKADKQMASNNQASLAQTTVNTDSAIQSIKKNIWIIKPGENTNRGQGIQVAKDYEEIKKIIDESTTNKKRTCIVQKYIHNPLLINKRKFDIRAYAFLSSINGSIKGYWYADGYLRTSCREFTLNNLANRMIHLTNDAVQKHAEDYGKFEPGNKLSYNDFQNYIDKHFSDLNVCFERDLLPQMKKLATDTFRAVYGKIDPKRRVNTFEIYGLDFMFDDEFKTYLIEVNTNPCLELGCPLLARLIPNMVENALRITIDPLFPPPENFSQKKCIVNDICPDNKFELIFDEKVDGPYLNELMKEKNNIIIEIDEEELSDCDEREEIEN